MKINSVLIIFIFAISIAGSSCSSARISPQQKKFLKAEKKMLKENKKIVADFHKHHYNIQPDRTQKMMNNSRKRSKNINKGKQISFFDHIFKRKRSKSCNGN